MSTRATLQHLVEVVLLAWFWLTPIVYQWGLFSARLASRGLAWIVLLNPSPPSRWPSSGPSTTGRSPTDGVAPLLPRREPRSGTLRNLAAVGIVSSVVLLDLRHQDLRPPRRQLRRGSSSRGRPGASRSKDVSKVFHLDSARGHLHEGALRPPPRAADRARSSGPCGTSSIERGRGPDPGAARPQRLGQVDVAQAHRRDPQADRRHGPGPRAASPRSSSWGPASTPSSPAGRTSTSTAPILGMSKAATATPLRRDRRVRRAGAVHRPAGQALLVRACTFGSGSPWPSTSTPDVLLVDEVLAVGDENFQRKCLDRVQRFQRQGRTIIVVSHAADLVRQICDLVAVLDHGEVVSFDEPALAIRVFREHLLDDELERRARAEAEADQSASSPTSLRASPPTSPWTSQRPTSPTAAGRRRSGTSGSASRTSRSTTRPRRNAATCCRGSQ